MRHRASAGSRSWGSRVRESCIRIVDFGDQQADPPGRGQARPVHVVTFGAPESDEILWELCSDMTTRVALMMAPMLPWLALILMLLVMYSLSLRSEYESF